MDTKEIVQIPSLALAYIGDTIFETKVREYYLNCGLRKVVDLHKAVTKCVCADFQARFYDELLPVLNEAEIEVLKRGRNVKSRKNKSTDVQSYHKSTAVEALVGYLYLSEEKQRLEEVLSLLTAFIERND